MCLPLKSHLAYPEWSWTRNLPLDAPISPVSILKMVVFPAPFTPSKPKHWVMRQKGRNATMLVFIMQKYRTEMSAQCSLSLLFSGLLSKINCKSSRDTWSIQTLSWRFFMVQYTAAYIRTVCLIWWRIKDVSLIESFLLLWGAFSQWAGLTGQIPLISFVPASHWQEQSYS